MKQGVTLGLIVGIPIFLISLLFSLQNNLPTLAVLKSSLVLGFVIGAIVVFQLILKQLFSVNEKVVKDHNQITTILEEAEKIKANEGKGGTIDFTTPDEQIELFQPLDVDKLRAESD